MNPLLQRHEGLSTALNTEAWLFREDQFWQEQATPQIWQQHRERPHGSTAVLPEHGGNKIRMLQHLDLTGVRGVSTTGTTQSNQIRQIAAYLAWHRCTIPFRACTIPEVGDPDVDPDMELQRGNLRLAMDLYPHTEIVVLPRNNEHNRKQLARWTSEQDRPDVVWIPRGMAGKMGSMGATDLGQSINRALQRSLWENTLVLVAAGSGTTLLGLQRAVRRGTVLGVCTHRSPWEQVNHMRPHIEGTGCIRLTNGSPPSSEEIQKWDGVLGLDLDHQWCRSLYRVLENWRQSIGVLHHDSDRMRIGTGTWMPHERFDQLVLVVTGLEQSS